MYKFCCDILVSLHQLTSVLNISIHFSSRSLYIDRKDTMHFLQGRPPPILLLAGRNATTFISRSQITNFFRRRKTVYDINRSRTLIPIFFCTSNDSSRLRPGCWKRSLTESTVPRRSRFSINNAADASWSMSVSMLYDETLPRWSCGCIAGEEAADAETDDAGAGHGRYAVVVVVPRSSGERTGPNAGLGRMVVGANSYIVVRPDGI